MSCTKTYNDYLCRCLPYDEQLRVNTFLPFLAAGYKYRLTDKFGARYEGEADRQVDGTLLIDLVDFPDGFFTEFSGGFKLELFAGDLCNQISFPMIRQFDTIEFEVSAGTTQKAELGCAYPECEQVP